MTVLALGGWKWMVRRTAPVVLEWPGGGWTFGAVCGLVTLGGVVAGLWLSAVASDRTGGRGRVTWASALACWWVAIGAGLYVLAALPGKNCRSYKPGCTYIPGSGSAFLMYLLTVGVVGWILYRRSAASSERAAAERRARMRKLRKKGKGKSRAAAARADRG
ncbi:hypothetical protein ACQB60_26260 [Actinomycetota bacterium Odt1-20B]